MEYCSRFCSSLLLLVSLVCGLKNLVLAQTSPPKSDLPKAEVLLDGYIQKTGGKEAYDKIKTWIFKSNLSIAGATLPETTYYAKEPNLRYMWMEYPGFGGKVEAGSDGKVSWEKNTGREPKFHTEDNSKGIFFGLPIGIDPNWRQIYKSFKTEGIENVNGREVYRVKLMNKNGAHEYRYFDKRTGLVVKMKAKIKPDDSTMVEGEFSDYKKVGELLIPHKVNATEMNKKMEIRINNIQLNAEIPKGTFDLPNEIKELIKKKANDMK